MAAAIATVAAKSSNAREIAILEAAWPLLQSHFRLLRIAAKFWGQAKIAQEIQSCAFVGQMQFYTDEGIPVKRQGRGILPLSPPPLARCWFSGHLIFNQIPFQYTYLINSDFYRW